MGRSNLRHTSGLKFMRPFFLVDCNNFFVSCERVFNPTLRHKAVVVLSSNDACIIARSNEAKKLGIPMGAAVWEYEALLRRHNVLVYSANFALYGDMSARVMLTLTQFFPDIEIYSIDEAFLHAPACNSYTHYGRQVRDEVIKQTGIPISIGVGATKTLAKIANYVAKKFPEYAGVFDATAADLDAVLKKIPVEEIWGVGYRYAKKLHAKNIRTAYDFQHIDERWVKKNMTVVGLKTLRELRGIPCLSLEQTPQQKQSITVSRLFGNKTTNSTHIKQALASYVTSAAQKLRAQHSLAHHITVFAVTARYHDPQHHFASTSVSLAMPTAYTPTLITAAHQCLEQLYMPELTYKKVGVILSDLVPADGIQLSTYAPEPKSGDEQKIMKTIDRINQKMGKNTVTFAANGIQQSWKMQQLKKSQCFTTNWHELLTIHV